MSCPMVLPATPGWPPQSSAFMPTAMLATVVGGDGSAKGALIVTLWPGATAIEPGHGEEAPPSCEHCGLVAVTVTLEDAAAATPPASRLAPTANSTTLVRTRPTNRRRSGIGPVPLVAWLPLEQRRRDRPPHTGNLAPAVRTQSTAPAMSSAHHHSFPALMFGGPSVSRRTFSAAVGKLSLFLSTGGARAPASRPRRRRCCSPVRILATHPLGLVNLR